MERIERTLRAGGPGTPGHTRSIVQIQLIRKHSGTAWRKKYRRNKTGHRSRRTAIVAGAPGANRGFIQFGKESASRKRHLFICNVRCGSHESASGEVTNHRGWATESAKELGPLCVLLVVKKRLVETFLSHAKNCTRDFKSMLRKLKAF